MKMRIEQDAMGEIPVPAERYWGAQTQRCLQHFAIGTERMPEEVLTAFALIKKAAARANLRLGALDERRAGLIESVCDEILAGKLTDHFPLPVWQTGSGTHTNMNFNEVIASRGNELAREKLLHPNDHVNASQSSNDTFPASMHIAGATLIVRRLLPARQALSDTLTRLSRENAKVIKTGRTHLMDAAPLTLGQEISGWQAMLDAAGRMIDSAMPELLSLSLGGTAVGTGLNAPEGFGEAAAAEIAEWTGLPFRSAENKFYALSSRDALVFMHGALKALSCDLLKLANDVRLLASGPRCGIGELILPANEPGSSIMPGKVNPTQCEALSMVCVQVMGNDAIVGFASSQGSLELNVYLPVTINAFLQSARLLADAMSAFDRFCAQGIRPNLPVIQRHLEQSLMLVTALSPHIGYDEAARLAKYAQEKGCTLREAALELELLSGEEFDRIVDPGKMV